jgi:GAF domain-containing protein
VAEDKDKPRDELEREVSELRGRIAALEQAEATRKSAEQQLRRQSAVLSGINRILRQALTLDWVAEIADTCLAVAQELTGSKFGFIGELNGTGRFDTIAISNPGWDACKMPHSDATRAIKNMEIRGLDRMVLKEGRSRIVNDPGSHPDRVGTPRGHPQITCFLGVPLKRGRRTIGMFGLANKSSGYDLSDQEAVEALSDPFVHALLHKRAENEVRAFQEHFKRMAEDRNAELVAARERLRQALAEREQAEESLRRRLHTEGGPNQ